MTTALVAIALLGQSAPKPTGPRAIILPVLDEIPAEGSVSRQTWARASLLIALVERDFDVVSPIQIQAVAQSKRLDLTTMDGWTPDALRSIGDHFRAKFIFGIRLLSQTYTNPTPETSLAEAKASGMLFEVPTAKLWFQDREATSKVEFTATEKAPKDQGALERKALGLAATTPFAEFLEKFPKRKKPRG